MAHTKLTLNLTSKAAATTMLLALTASHAAAAPGAVTSNVNLRQGPGTTYTVIATIPSGTNVDIGDCSGQWCQIAWHGQNGYVIASSLVQGGGAPPNGPAAGTPPPPGYDEPVYVAPPPYYGPYYGYGPSYGYGPYYGRYYYGYGWGHRHW